MSRSSVQTTHVRPSFSAEEAAALCAWLTCPLPEGLAAEGVDISGIEPLALVSSVGTHDVAEPHLSLDAVVAAIVLGNIERRLPNWTAGFPQEEPVSARARRDPVRRVRRGIGLRPCFLLDIDWAFTAPGFSWPVQYWVTWLPFWDRHVVTIPADCGDAYGYPDIALEHFGPDEELSAAVGAIVKRDWFNLVRNCDAQPPEYVASGGLVPHHLAAAWVAEVWPEDEDIEENDEITLMPEQEAAAAVRRNVLDRLVEAASWSRPSRSGTNSNLLYGARAGALRRYADDFEREHGHWPEEIHTVVSSFERQPSVVVFHSLLVGGDGERTPVT